MPWLQGVAIAPVPWVQPRYVDPEEERGGFVSIKVWRLAERMTLETSLIRRAFRAYRWMMDPDGEDRGDFSPPLLQELGVDSEATVFEVVTPLIPTIVKDEIDIESTVSDAFDRCLESLQRLYRAYITAENDWRVEIPTRRSIAATIPWTTSEPRTGLGGLGMFQTHEGATSLAVSIPTMDEERIHRMMVLLTRRTFAGESGDPVATALEHLRRAQRAYHVDADYQACLTWLYARGETLLDGLLLMIAWEQGVPANEAAQWFDRGLIGRIKTRYSSSLGGQWDVTLTDAPVGGWRDAVEECRHRVVHHGYRPSEREARQALDSSDRLEEFLFERLARKRRTVPKTALLWLGVPGLERRGLYDAYMRSVAEADDGREPWLSQYRKYVEDIRSLWRFQ